MNVYEQLPPAVFHRKKFPSILLDTANSFISVIICFFLINQTSKDRSLYQKNTKR